MVSKEYLTALGQFVHNYSNVEALLHMGFHVVAGIPPQVANIMKKEASAGNVISMLKVLIPHSPLPEEDRADFLVCIAQVEVLSQFRHRVIHRGAWPTEDGSLVADNLATMRSIESLELVEFTVADVEAAADDLLRIGLRLLDVLFPWTKRTNPPAFDLALRAPWRHKPAQPDKPHRKRTQPKPLRKPGSTRA